MATTERGFEREAGQSLAELSIVLGLLLVLLFGIVDAGRLIFAYNAVSAGAREGVRSAVVRGATSPLGTATNDDSNADNSSYRSNTGSRPAIGPSAAFDPPGPMPSPSSAGSPPVLLLNRLGHVLPGHPRGRRGGTGSPVCARSRERRELAGRRRGA